MNRTGLQMIVSPTWTPRSRKLSRGGDSETSDFSRPCLEVSGKYEAGHQGAHEASLVVQNIKDTRSSSVGHHLLTFNQLCHQVS